MSAVANPSQKLYKSTQVKSKYRPEIDGLRAFAVVAVIINHFNKDLLPSGYLGVDIFFVISGYVITSSLAGRESKNFLDFLTGFYERRIKRLVPALVVFVLITSVLISLFNPDPGVALGLGWRSLFGISNINLYLASTDYFAQSTELNPFTHTWSLGVEEQFYLLFPFLVWYSGFGQQAAKGARNLFFWVGALTIASLTSFIYLYQVNQPAAYFLMPPRFWEMAAGCLIFIGFQKRARIEQALEQVPPLLIVGAMVGAMFLPVSSAVPATVGVVVLTAVLIACLKEGTAAHKFFTLEKVVYLGLVSYSLYLWHWGVLWISRWTVGIHWWSVPLQVGLMLMIAAGSYEWVEKQTRRKFVGRRYTSIAIGATCLGLSASLVKLGGLAPMRFPYLGNSYEFYMLSNPIGNGKIPFDNENKMRSKEQKMIVLGNSHAGHLLPLVKEVSDEHSLAYRVIQSTAILKDQVFWKSIPSINGKSIRVGEAASQVRPDATNPELSKHLKQKNLILPTVKIDDEAIQAIRELRSRDILVLSSRHFYLYRNFFFKNGSKYYQTFRGDLGESLDKKALVFTWKSKLRKIVEGATSRNASVVFFAPLPEFQSMEPQELCTREWFRPRVSDKCNATESRNPMLRTRFLSEMKATLEELKNEFSNFYVFDPFPSLCPSDRTMCESWRDGGTLFSDNDHLSVRGALLLAKSFDRFLLSHSLLMR